jgi:RNA polymerase sigma-70 factor (ECF subfamily)
VVLRVLSGGGLTRLADPRPYLFKAVLNEARSVLRARTTDPLPDVAVEMGFGDFEVLEAVMGLPARQRAAVFLVFWGGETIEDTARLMGARAGTVRRYLHLAKRRLKECL